MIDIDRHFSRSMAQRGRGYYAQNRVTGLKRENDAWKATVLGSRTYSVRLKMDEDGGLLDAECSCPYARQNIWTYCKHVAAVACAVNAMMDREEKLVHKMPPAPPEKQGNLTPGDQLFPKAAQAEDVDYRSSVSYFDIPAAFSHLRLTVDQMAELQRTVDQKRVTMDEPFVRHDSTGEMMLCVLGNVSTSTRAYALQIYFGHNSIVSCSCTYRGCNCSFYNYHQDKKPARICAHLTALALQAAEYTSTHGLGDATDQATLSILEQYSRQNVKTVSSIEQQPAPVIALQPELMLSDYSYPKLRVRTGTGKRLLLVSNIPELVTTADRRGTLTLGKSLNLDFSTQTFDEASTPLAGWLHSLVIVASINSRANAIFEGKNEILLQDQILDEAFELLKGQAVRGGAAGGGELRLADGDGGIRLTIQPVAEDGHFWGVRVDGRIPTYMAGARYVYWHNKERNELVRFSKAEMQKLLPLVRTVNRNPFHLTVGRGHLKSFFRHMLPQLREVCEITEVDMDGVARYLPPEPVFTFRLDADAANIYCDPIVRYDEEERPLNEPCPAWADEAQENRALQTVNTYFPDATSGRFACPKTSDTFYEAMTDGVDALNALGEVLASEQFQTSAVRRSWKLSVGVSVESDLLNLTLLSDDFSVEELRELLTAYTQRKRYHRLRSGELVQLEGENTEELDTLFQAAHVPAREFATGNMQLPLYRALYLDKLLEDHNELVVRRNRELRRMVKAFKTVSDSDDEPPASLAGILRPYQLSGFKWLMTLLRSGFGGILADDMGLGKTLQAIAVLLHEKEAGVTAPSLIVCPASLIYNWQAELNRFAPALTTQVITGTQAERQRLIAQTGDHDVLITSYDLLKRDFPHYQGQRFHTVWLDEAQYIKTHTSAAAKSVKTVQAAHRFALTGTPVENRLNELWSIFDFLMPGFLYGYDVFRREMETPITKNGDEAARERLRRMVGPFILRRLKGDVLRDLPAKTEEARAVALDGEQRRLYDAQLTRLLDMISHTSDTEYEHNKITVLAEILRLRQLCCDPGLLFENYSGSSAKREALRDLLESAMDGGHRVLVYSQFTTMLAMLEEDLRAAGIPYFKLTGDTPKEERLGLANRFNSGDTPVFLISLKAGGTGLNLVGADIVVHYDPWWNLAAQNQATDRAHRIGQEKPVSVYKLIAKDTIEEKIVALQETKRDLAESILSGEHASLGSLSREELMRLLETGAGQ